MLPVSYAAGGRLKYCHGAPARPLRLSFQHRFHFGFVIRLQGGFHQNHATCCSLHCCSASNPKGLTSIKNSPQEAKESTFFFWQNNIAFATIYIRQSACILAWTMHRSETFWYIVPIKKINAFIISLCSLLENNRSLLISFFLFLRSRAWTIHGLRGWAEVLFLSPSFSSCFEEKLFHVADTHQQRLTQSGRYQVDSSEISTLWMWLNMIDIQDRYLIALK